VPIVYSHTGARTWVKPPRNTDLPDLRREDVFGRFEIEPRLHVHPKRAAGLEELAEPQRGVGGHGFSLRAMRSIRVRGTCSAGRDGVKVLA
jgi:hypothetical protein